MFHGEGNIFLSFLRFIRTCCSFRFGSARLESLRHATPALPSVSQNLDTTRAQPWFVSSRGLSAAKEALITAALQERVSQRAIARTFRVARTTVRELLKKSPGKRA